MRTSRRGLALPLVLVLVAVAAVAIFVFQHVVQQEAQGTHKLVRTLHAEAICDRVVNRLAAVVGQHPWEDRFYLLDAMARAAGAATLPEAKYVFDQDRFPFGDEGPDFASGDASFTGSIKDTSALEQRYRITVRARYRGVAVLGVYDLTHARGTMGPLNRSAIDLRKMKVDEAPLDAQLDAEMDAIPAEVSKPENVLGPDIAVPSLPALWAPPGAPPAATPTEQTAGLVGGKLVPAFNPPAGIAPGTPEATAVTQATGASTARAGGRAESDFERARTGGLPPGSVLQPGAAVPPPRKPAGPAPDPNADPFASDPGGLGNAGGTYTPAGYDPSLGSSDSGYNPDGTEMTGSSSTDSGDGTSTASTDGTSADNPDNSLSDNPDNNAASAASTESVDPQLNEDGTEKVPQPGSEEDGAGQKGENGLAGSTENDGTGDMPGAGTETNDGTTSSSTIENNSSTQTEEIPQLENSSESSEV